VRATKVTEYTCLATLPLGARALFGQDAFSTLAWYASTLEAALPAGATACFQVVAVEGVVQAVLPMLLKAGRLSALTTPYTCLWQPLLAAGADPVGVGRTLAPLWRRAAPVRLDCVPSSPGTDGLLRGLGQAGLTPLQFDHFGNWFLDVRALDWNTYVASRPGPLRSAITRHTRRLMKQDGARFSLVQSAAGLEDAIAAYDAVYAASWKQPEPFPAFNATFIRASAAVGTLRLATLHLGPTPIAAQFWLVHEGWAAVLKLAYDEAFKKLAPGNVLTALVIRHLLEQEHVHTLDFGRGDDEYKSQWTGSRRQRVGALVVNPLSATGVLAIARHSVGKVRKAFFSEEKKQKTFPNGSDESARPQT
jgi:hypothetical protein